MFHAEDEAELRELRDHDLNPLHVEEAAPRWEVDHGHEEERGQGLYQPAPGVQDTTGDALGAREVCVGCASGREIGIIYRMGRGSGESLKRFC